MPTPKHRAEHIHAECRVKARIAGRKKRRRKAHRKAVEIVVKAGSTNAPIVKSNALPKICKFKAVAAEVGGLRILKGACGRFE